MRLRPSVEHSRGRLCHTEKPDAIAFAALREGQVPSVPRTFQIRRASAKPGAERSAAPDLVPQEPRPFWQMRSPCTRRDRRLNPLVAGISPAYTYGFAPKAERFRLGETKC